MSNSPFRTVTIAGGTGRLGHNIANAALNDGSYKVKILRKKPENDNVTSKLLASKGAEIVFVDYYQKNDLVKALEGTDVLISAIGYVKVYDVEIPLLAAAKEAGVKRFIPSEFGGEYDESGVHPILKDKYKFREDVEKSGLEYTYIFNGLFQDYLHVFFNVKNKTATFYVDGNKKLSATAMVDIGKFTIESLKIPEARNAPIRVAGATLSFNEWLQVFEKATGSKWVVKEDKELRQRFQNKVEPIPSLFEDFLAFMAEDGVLKNTINDKFNFTPRPVSESVGEIVKQA